MRIPFHPAVWCLVIWQFLCTSDQQGTEQVAQLFIAGRFEYSAGLIEVVPLHLPLQINDLVPHLFIAAQDCSEKIKIRCQGIDLL